LRPNGFFRHKLSFIHLLNGVGPASLSGPSPLLEFAMRTWFVATLALPLVCTFALHVAAQERPSEAPGVVTEGSSNTSIGGVSAARKGDAAAGEGAIVGGSPDVFINGRPAATVGDKTGCGGIVVGGGGGVFINGKPAARTGDLTTGCPGK
jgi:uncharacterized Zn-binding protein involved in type VI secretion